MIRIREKKAARKPVASRLLGVFRMKKVKKKHNRVNRVSALLAAAETVGLRCAARWPVGRRLSAQIRPTYWAGPIVGRVARAFSFRWHSVGSSAALGAWVSS